MASPERSENPPQPTKSEIASELTAIERQLEKANEIENPIERSFKRDELLEKYDELQGEMDETTPTMPE